MTGTCSTCSLWCGSGDDQHAKCRATTRLLTMNRGESCEKWDEKRGKCLHCGATTVRVGVCGSCGAPQ